MEIVFVVAIAENGVIGQGNAIPWRLKSDHAALQGADHGQAGGDGPQDVSVAAKPLAGRTNIVVTRDAGFRRTARWS